MAQHPIQHINLHLIIDDKILFQIFQAMTKLLEGCEDVSGQIFYLNDGNPTNLFFFLNPLYT